MSDVWYAVYETASGDLYSTGQSVATPERLTARGLTAVALNGPPPAGMAWNPVTKAFDMDAVIPGLRRLTPVQFMLLFTVQERIALRTSTDPVIGDLLWLVNAAQEIDLDDVTTQAAIGYLSTAGVITSERIATVLAGERP